MTGNRRNLVHSLPSDAIAVFDREGMRRWLKLDLGPHAHRLSMDHGLQIERLRISGNGVRQPAEIGRLSFSIRILWKFFLLRETQAVHENDMPVPRIGMRILPRTKKCFSSMRQVSEQPVQLADAPS
jgi:hypothetical protein